MLSSVTQLLEKFLALLPAGGKGWGNGPKTWGIELIITAPIVQKSSSGCSTTTHPVLSWRSMVLRFPQHPLQHQQWLQSLNLNSMTGNDTTAGSNSELCLFRTKWPWIKALVSISPPRDVFTILAKRSGVTSLARQSSLRFHSSIAPKKRYKQKLEEWWLVEYICFNKGPYSINRHTLDPFCFLTLPFHNFLKEREETSL